jgi:SprB repeat
VPIATNATSAVISCGNALSTITVNTTAGISTPFQYSLNGSALQVANTFSNLSAGIYTILAIDSNNCTSSNIVNITAPLPLMITNVTPNLPSCTPANNGSITFTTTGGTGTILFSTNNINYQSLNPFVNLTAGTYTIYVKDANNCTTSSTVTLTAPTLPIISTVNTTDALCGNAVGSITATAATVNGTLSYTINNPTQTNGSGTFTSLGANNYTLTVTDAFNCKATSLVSVNATPVPVINSVTKTPNKCGLGNGTLAINASGGTGSLTYSINSTFGSNNAFINLAGTSYVASVKDSAGCIATSNVTILQAPSPTISINATPIACHNGTTTINTTVLSGNSSPFQYSINGGSFTSASSFANTTFGNYTITIRDTNLCTGIATISLSNPSPIVISSVTSTIAWCTPSNNASISITASGGAPALVYSANNGTSFQAGSIILNRSAGTYTIVVRDSKLCTTTTTHTVISSPQVSLSLVGTTDFCTKNVGTITATNTGGTPSFFYTINGGPLGGSNVFNGLGAGTYTIGTQDARGCASTSTVTINATTAPMFSVVQSTPNKCNANNGTISTVASSSSIITSYKLLSTTNATGLFSNLSHGNYTITATDINNCSNTTIVIVANAPSPIISANANPILCLARLVQ